VVAVAEFGIIDNIEEIIDGRISYDPIKYGCVSIDDDIYIDEWWDKLVLMKTYFHSLERLEFALARWGITLIPPESLPIFYNIVITDKRINDDDNLVALANKIKEAMDKDKFMIHYGV